MPKFLVVGASGRIGSQVVRGLVAQGHAIHALSRNPRPMDDLGGQVTSFAGAVTHPPSIASALDGTDAAFLLWPTFSAEQAPAVVDAIASKSRHIVFLSAFGVPDDPEVHSPLFHAGIERLIRDSGIGWTFLRPTGFASNTLGWADQIKAGDTVRWPYGRARRALIHELDIAEVAVKVLSETGHSGMRYVLSGPEQLTQIEQVERIGRALGRPLAYIEMDPATARAELLKSWGSADFVDAALQGWADMIENPEPVTSTVSQITGRPAFTFAQWAEDHVADFGGTNQSAASSRIF